MNISEENIDPVILVGAFCEIVELCEACGCTIIGCIDNRQKGCYKKYPILGSDRDIDRLLKYRHIPLVVTPDPPLIRKKLFELYNNHGFIFKTLISPDAKVSPSAHIGTGAVIQSGANVSSEARIGNFVKLNTCANVMHECTVGDFATVAPNAVILGRVDVANDVYVGAHSTLLPEIRIASGVTIGAGAVVTKSVLCENSTVKGVPAK